MTPELFQAILAMDSYNRTGSAETLRGLVLPVTNKIGDAVILQGTGGVAEDPAHGFFAQAYDLNGQKIISFRGTDTSPPGQFALDAVTVFRRESVGTPIGRRRMPLSFISR